MGCKPLLKGNFVGGSSVSKGLGIGVLAVGLLGLGWWAQSHNAGRIEQHVRQLAETTVAGSVHGVTTTVAGRDILVSGVADTQAEADGLVANLNALPSRRVVVSELTVLEPASPFTLDVTKDETGLTAQGQVPTEALRADLAPTLGEAAKGLTLASGAPEGWADMARAGLAALGPLTTGTLSLIDDTLTIRGQAVGPDEAAAVDAALAALPADAVSKDIMLLDDGTPPSGRWTIAPAPARWRRASCPRGWIWPRSPARWAFRASPVRSSRR